MRKRLFIALIIILMLVPMSIAATEKKQLKFETTYSFAGGSAPNDLQGRLIIWSGSVSGAFEGEMEWWMHFGDPAWNRPTGITNHWEDAVWIIYPDDDDPDSYIMGGEWGSTTMLPETAQKDAVWRANGEVTDASDGYTYLIGRRIHDGGNVVLGNNFPFTAYGWGEFRIH